MIRCWHCDREISPEDVRVYHVPSTWGEPACDETRCIYCAPSEPLERDWDWERDRREAEGDMP